MCWPARRRLGGARETVLAAERGASGHWDGGEMSVAMNTSNVYEPLVYGWCKSHYSEEAAHSIV